MGASGAGSGAEAGDGGRPRRVVGDPPPARPAFTLPASAGSSPGIVRPGRNQSPGAGRAAQPAAAAPAPAPQAAKGSAGPAAVRRPHGSVPGGGRRRELAGAIRGPIKTEAVRHRFRGPKIVAPLLLLAIVAAPLAAAHIRAGYERPWLAATEIYVLTLLAALLLIGRSHNTAIGEMAYSGRAFLPRRRRSAAAAGAAASRPKPGRAPEYSTTAHRFRLEDFGGASHPCVFVGEPKGGSLEADEYVRIAGRRSRSGEVKARQVTVLSSAVGVPVKQITPSRRTDFAIASRFNRVCYAGIVPLLAAFAACAVLAR